MLELKNIVRTYVTGELRQDALKNVSLVLRNSEFVAVLGHSGSGKTTLLNIIGGLDQYTSGDLVIDGVSTRKYKDRNWDVYRNHTVGFVFQSYNLIPHQSVLKNVELALTLSGISARERKERATKALKKVGLKDHIHKKPNQLSGGQMQRVAIARALINDPRIILADEPTGALDSETSTQVMEILKEIARDRLVVMVTHNPELAEKYATRIVRLSDGEIIGDTDPCLDHDETVEKPRVKKTRSMSFFTAFSLSLSNLLTKKLRTVMTSFAGSIGITGIALILSVSTGFQAYIDQVEKDTLSTYPLTIERDTADMSTMLLAASTAVDEVRQSDSDVTELKMISNMFSHVGTNHIPEFLAELEKNGGSVKEGLSSLRISYGISPQIYQPDFSYGIVQINPSRMFSNAMSSSGSRIMSYSGVGIFSEMLDDPDLLGGQYDVLAGRWPEKYDELLLVLPQKSAISDFLVYGLGLKDQAELKEMVAAVSRGESYEDQSETMKWNYEDFLGMCFKLVNAADYYRYNSEYSVYEDMRQDESYMKELITNGTDLKIVGVVVKKEGVSAAALSTGVCYRSDLLEEVMKRAYGSEIVRKQLTEKEKDVFSGRSFEDLNEENNSDNKLDFENMISVDMAMIQDAFQVNANVKDLFDPAQSAQLILDSSQKIADNLKSSASPMAEMIKTVNLGIAEGMIEAYQNSVRIEDIVCPEYLDENAHVLGCRIPEGKEEQYTENGAYFRIDDPVIRVADQSILQCDEYIDPANPNKGCRIPEGKEAEYQAVTVLKEDPVSVQISFAPLATNAFAQAFFQEELFTQILNALPQEMTENMDSEMVRTWTKDIAPVLFEAYAAKARELSEAPLYLVKEEDLKQLDSEAILKEALERKEIEERIAYLSATSIKDMTVYVIAQGLAEYSAEMLEPMSKMMGKDMLKIDSEKFAKAFRFTMSEEELSRLMNAYLNPSTSATYESNLTKLGYGDKSDPLSVSFYMKDFDSKENFLAYLDGYNSRMEEEKKDDLVISYTDITGILMDGVKTIVDAVSYVLIAFVAISLIVSSIMIGVITLISVMERTKEIGILRAIGASKRDISRIFNAETFIIGLLAGIIGIAVSLLALIPINKILYSLTKIEGLKAVLPAKSSLILILISVGLTLFAGIIPSSSASHKNPVEALRTE